MTLPINQFTDEHAFLHNDYRCKITIEGIDYFCVTHAHLTIGMHYETTKKALREMRSIDEVKDRASGRKRIDGWTILQKEAMAILLAKKFAKPRFKKLLIETYPCKLVFGNSNGNRFWGVSGGIGKNLLGTLLMELRDTLRGS